MSRKYSHVRRTSRRRTSRRKTSRRASRRASRRSRRRPRRRTSRRYKLIGGSDSLTRTTINPAFAGTAETTPVAEAAETTSVADGADVAGEADTTSVADGADVSREAEPAEQNTPPVTVTVEFVDSLVESQDISDRPHQPKKMVDGIDYYLITIVYTMDGVTRIQRILDRYSKLRYYYYPEYGASDISVYLRSMFPERKLGRLTPELRQERMEGLRKYFEFLSTKYVEGNQIMDQYFTHVKGSIFERTRGPLKR